MVRAKSRWVLMDREGERGRAFVAMVAVLSAFIVDAVERSFTFYSWRRSLSLGIIDLCLVS